MSKCLFCDKPPIDQERCRVHLEVYRRMMRLPADPNESRRERRWEARVSR